jgi:hypothetical protein
VVIEVALGVMLIINYRPKFTTAALAVIIVFFTFLTFYSAYFNKVTDCGCFGDAVKLTPWESFYKDIFLLALIGILLIFRNSLRANNTFPAMLVSVFSFLIPLGMAFYAIHNLPYLDFRAYKEGVVIPQAMQPSAALQYSYVMSRNGEVVEMDQFPQGDEYEFVEMKLKNPEALPKISDFAVWNSEGDYTDEILSGPKILILVSNISKVKDRNLDEIGNLVEAYSNSGVEVAFVSASSEEEAVAFLSNRNWDISYYLADATVVKTIIRANPGIMVLQDGKVLGKFHHNNTPDAQKVDRLFGKVLARR